MPLIRIRLIIINDSSDNDLLQEMDRLLRQGWNEMMTAVEWLAITAAFLAAISVLPGTLGILMLTNKIAVKEYGARYIYGKAFWIGGFSAVLMAVGVFLALQDGRLSSLPFLSAAVVFSGIMIFGFFMHTKLMFKPVKNPKYMSVDEAIEKFGQNEEVVGVIDFNGKSWAYVARLARRPHIVYQPKGDEPFMMTHCILAHSSMAYKLGDGFRQPDITITAALANNLVFYDKTSQCSIIQLHNGSLDRSFPLKTMPTVTCSLATWKQLYPDAPVWYRNREWRDVFYLKLLARADVIDPESPVIVYPLQHEHDRRLPMKDFVLGVQIGEQTMSYPVSLFEKQPVLESELAGVKLVIFSAFNNDFINIYDREPDGRTLNFEAADQNRFRDRATGSEWTATGECISGELEGKSLTPVPHYNKIFWYVWADYHPGTPICGLQNVSTSAA